MSLQLIGIIIMGLAGLGLIHSTRASFFVMGLACLLQAAAAIVVTAIGGASITPGHLALGFFLLAVVMRRGGLSASLSSVIFPRTGFWLAMATLWAVMTSFIMPRLFYGMFEVYPLGIQNSEGYIIKIPLGPVSSNMTQAIYYIGNLLAFLAVTGLARSHGLIRSAAIALLAVIAANLGFVVIDQLTYAAGQAHLLDFIRNAGYGQLFDAEVLGMKRITGTFPEASSFAGTSIGLFAFALRLWRGGLFGPWSGGLALATFFCLVLSTSTTAYVALAAYLAIVYSRAFTGADRTLPRTRRAAARQGVLIGLLPFAALAVAIIVAIKPDLLNPVTEFFDQSVTNKLTSDSGSERTRWNMAAARVIGDSVGLGAGLGSVRASSFLLGLPANIGVFGSLLFGVFLLGVLQPQGGVPVAVRNLETDQIMAAGRSACFGMFLAAATSAGTVDLTILFFVFAGLANASVYQTVNFDRVGPGVPIPEPYMQGRRRGGRKTPDTPPPEGMPAE